MGDRFTSIASALPDFVLSAVFLVTWVDPLRLGERTVRYLVLLMLLEFIIIHSSAAMVALVFTQQTRVRKVAAIVGMSLFYSVFAGAFALAFSTWWPLWAFWGLTLNRLLPVILGALPTDREMLSIVAGWIVSVMAYLLLTALTAVLPVPALGITDAVIRSQEFGASGLWVEQPQRVMACGFLYFATLGTAELFIGRWGREA